MTDINKIERLIRYVCSDLREFINSFYNLETDEYEGISPENIDKIYTMCNMLMEITNSDELNMFRSISQEYDRIRQVHNAFKEQYELVTGLHNTLMDQYRLINSDEELQKKYWDIHSKDWNERIAKKTKENNNEQRKLTK